MPREWEQSPTQGAVLWKELHPIGRFQQDAAREGRNSSRNPGQSASFGPSGWRCSRSFPVLGLVLQYGAAHKGSVSERKESNREIISRQDFCGPGSSTGSSKPTSARAGANTMEDKDLER